MTALVTAALVAPALAGDNRAQRVDFLDLDGPTPNCDLAPPDRNTPEKSSAIINRDDDGTVRVQLQLKDALPNTTYNVGIWKNDCMRGADFYSVRTNNQGNANRKLEQVPDPEQTINDVVLTASADLDFKQTPKVTFGP